MPTLSVGAPAPLFTLADEKGTSFSLESMRNFHPVVLVFYPGDMTPGCTMQLCSIRDEWKQFEEAGIYVYGVNPGNATSHERFKNTFKLPFPLLIDTDKKVSDAYDALYSFFGIKIVRRTVFGIDKNGTVRYMKRGIPRTQDILKAMHKYL